MREIRCDLYFVENGMVSIPNRELMDKFCEMLMKEPSLGYVHRLAAQSPRVLKATLAEDEDTETPLPD